MGIHHVYMHSHCETVNVNRIIFYIKLTHVNATFSWLTYETKSTNGFSLFLYILKWQQIENNRDRERERRGKRWRKSGRGKEKEKMKLSKYKDYFNV